MKNFLFCSVLFTFCSCSSIKEAPHNRELLNNAPVGITSQEIIKSLTEEGGLGMTSYQVSGYPITKSLVKAWEREEKNDKAALALADRSCFFFTISSKTLKEHLKFEEWPAKLLDAQKKEHKIIWHPTAVTANPISQDTPTYHGKGDHWFNSGVGCTEDLISLEEGFTIYLNPQQVQWPLGGDLKLDWVFDQKQLSEVKKNRKQDYRGW
ncbi:MAG: hypothetical protein WCG27_07605 [Pseudomonadota bacterium]